MAKRDDVRAAAIALYKEGATLGKKAENNEYIGEFGFSYQRWYTQALKVVASLAPDRLAEFRGYYEIDSKRKRISHGTYVIQDFLKSVVPAGPSYEEFDAKKRALLCFFNQLAIFNAVVDRFDSILNDIEGSLFSELEDNEIAVARRLAKINLRAAGALTGVVVEGHLQKVAIAHKVNISKKNPTIADLNDPLKQNSVIDLPTWRKISFLADIRNLCSHKKDVEPTDTQVEELIQGAEWVTKNVF